MARKEVIQAAATGSAVPKREPELAEEDTFDFQKAALEPTFTEFETFDGKTHYLPNEFTLKDIYRHKVTNTISGFIAVLCYELEQLGQKLGVETSQYALTAALLKDTVQSALADVIAVVLQKPKKQFDGTCDATNLVIIYRWIITMATQGKSSGESNPKK